MIPPFPLLAESLAWNGTTKLRSPLTTNTTAKSSDSCLDNVGCSKNKKSSYSGVNNNNIKAFSSVLLVPKNKNNHYDNTTTTNNNNKKHKSTYWPSKSSTNHNKQHQHPPAKPQNISLQPTAHVIQDYVERVLADSSLLQPSMLHDNHAIPRCSRSELKVHKMIGQGSFSQVFSLKQSHTPSSRHRQRQGQPQQQVVKQLHPALFVTCAASSSDNDASAIQNHQQALDHAAADLVLEALYLSRLRHPHIVAVSALSADMYHDLFVCLEYVPQTLADQWHSWRQEQQQHQRALLLPRQLLYATQLASALDFLHDHRVVVRDLKPDNIGIQNTSSSSTTTTETVKLLDFGLCRELPHNTSSNGDNKDDDDNHAVFYMTQVGTVRYCAPEILLGHAYNCKVDVFSFAVVLYELMTLQTAFPQLDSSSAASTQDHIEKVCHQSKRPGLALHQLPSGVERVIRKSWQRNLDKRWSMKQVHQAMQMELDKL